MRVGKAADVIERGDKAQCGHRTYARYRHQTPAYVVLVDNCLEFAIGFGNLLVEQRKGVERATDIARQSVAGRTHALGHRLCCPPADA
jgi:hypothetical protein